MPQGCYLTPAALSIFGAFNNTWQVQHLNLGASVMNHAGNASQGCELIGGNLHVANVRIRFYCATSATMSTNRTNGPVGVSTLAPPQ